MKLKIVLPSEVFLEQEVNKVIAEGPNGSFCLLPRHVDFVSSLVPGLLAFYSLEGKESFAAIDEGILVKCTSNVLVSTRRAVLGPDLGLLRKTITEQFRVLAGREKLTRSASAKLEAELVRRFVELERRVS